MINSYNIAGKLAIDTKSVDDLRMQAQQNPDQALKEVAQQFEALFVNMMLKSMREATPKNGLFDSQQTQFYTQMLDQQLAQNMTSRGIGLADMMVQQLARTPIQPTQPVQSETAVGTNEEILAEINPDIGSATSSSTQSDISLLLWSDPKTGPNASEQPKLSITAGNEIPLSAPIPTNPLSSLSNQPEGFIDSLWSHAKQAEQATGIPANFMIAQAALESGWGKHEIRHADNRTSFNLFGIKAGQSWKGDVVETVTTEYINGMPEKMVEKFRAYNSYAESFQDYANLLINNPRYSAVINSQDASAFAHGLQKAGYATDPHYADKLIRIINSSSMDKHLAI